MNTVQQALWYIESHFGEPITLEEIASAGGVSRHHMTRAFGGYYRDIIINLTRPARLHARFEKG